MDLCGEHGFNQIAYAYERNKNNCPACEQIEDLTNDYDKRIEELLDTIEDRNNTIDELEAKIEDSHAE